MKRRGFWIALVVFLGLGAYIRFYESRRPPEPGPAPPFLAVEPTRVTGITAAFVVDTTRIEKKDGTWRIVSPIDFPADPVAVEALLSRCRDLQLIRSFPLEAGRADRYGLATPGAWIQLHLDDGTERKILIGSPAQASPAFYVQVAGQDRVGLLPEQAVDNYFRKETNGWRRPDLLMFRPADIVSLEMRSGDRVVRLARKTPRDAWWLEEPFPGYADQALLGEYLTGLAATKARSYPDDHPSRLDTYGLAAPAGIISLAEAGGRVHRLEIGAPFQGLTGPERYALSEGRPNVFGVPAPYVDLARHSHFHFRDKRVFRASRRDLATLFLGAGRDSIGLRPDSTGVWRVAGEAAPPGGPPPDRTFLVDEWLAAAPDSIVSAAGPDGARSGASRPSLVVEARWRTGRVERLELGAAGRSGRGEEQWPARLIFSDPPRPGEVFLLEPGIVRESLALVRLAR